MHPNETLIHNFYACFQNLDAEGMERCYHEKIIFNDPVFTNLKGVEASAMWKMLIQTLKKSGNSWELTFRNIEANENTGTCHWEAHYVFSLTGRKIHNKIDARFKFQDGKIIEHTDSFNFYRWSCMAFGTKGYLLGWTPLLKNKVQATVKKRLKEFMIKE